MLSRLLPKPSHFRILYHLSPKSHPYPGNPDFPSLSKLSRLFSSNHNNNNNNRDKGQSDSNTWKFSHESDGKFDHLFTESSENLAGITDADSSTNESWLEAKGGENDNVFEGVNREVGGNGGGEVRDGEEWMTEAWKFGEEEKDDVFDIGEAVREVGETEGESQGVESDRSEEEKRLQREEEQELSAIIKGPNRAFGDLIAASGITDAMLDSLIALKDLNEIQGLPPLSEIEDMRYEKSTRKSIRSEIERLKQEEAAKARVRQVDGKGRAYGTGRRKCSVARVWIQPGDGKFIINDKQFDVYFPMLDHRAALLRPFSETKTLGLWDVNCTVKGGGVSGQVGAILLGVSRALQNWEPDLRPALRSEGFLTRDPRVVERKKPGKAKARKSFQWVKR